MIESVIQWLLKLPIALIYVIIGLGAGIENFIPPIPADTFVLLGAFLSAGGRGSPWLVFFITWGSNVVSAVIVYFLAYHYGQHFFEMPVGHWLINQRQRQQIGKFYDKWGVPAIFFSRFFPAFRAMVPVFAGVSHVRFVKVFIPLALASALWYGFVVYLGAVAGKNWQAIMAFFSRFSTVLLIIAAVLLIAFGTWWWRTRRHAHDEQ